MRLSDGQDVLSFKLNTKLLIQPQVINLSRTSFSQALVSIATLSLFSLFIQVPS
jgi:hypothetical protein